MPRIAAKFGHRYPWSDWLADPLPDGGLTLVRGADFPDECEPASFATMLRRRFRDTGLTRRVRLDRDRVLVTAKPAL